MTNQLNETLSTRATTHGDFEDNSYVMQHLKTFLREQDGWNKLDYHQREALDMICHKIGRILCGNPNFPDHWLDVAGYAQLVENILTTGKSHPSTSSSN
jgi:hypothetical protein